MNRVAFGSALVMAAVCGVYAQAPNSNAAPTPYATFGNNRPPKKDKAATSRVVSGQVVDENGAPLEGALVTLTNDVTKERHEFFTKKDGRYSFEELSFSIDYQVQARYKNLNSESRKLSQYDKSPKMVRILQIYSETPTPAAAEAKKITPAPKQ